MQHKVIIEREVPHRLLKRFAAHHKYFHVPSHILNTTLGIIRLTVAVCDSTNAVTNTFFVIGYRQQIFCGSQIDNQREERQSTSQNISTPLR